MASLQGGTHSTDGTVQRRATLLTPPPQEKERRTSMCQNAGTPLKMGAVFLFLFSPKNHPEMGCPRKTKKYGHPYGWPKYGLLLLSFWFNHLNWGSVSFETEKTEKRNPPDFRGPSSGSDRAIQASLAAPAARWGSP